VVKVAKMKEYPNFYENLKEANDRLRGTVVMYDGQPVYVFAITDHKKDGIFRAYIKPIGWDPKTRQNLLWPDVESFSWDGLGAYIDEWMEKNPDRLLRKQLNSPLFNKFRPFPLGMYNIEGDKAVYLERAPARPSMEQGLNGRMLFQHDITVQIKRGKSPYVTIGILGKEMKDCILGDHPDAKTVLKNLLDPEVENESAAFHRHFALARGPIGMLFLAYKEDIIGVLPKNDFSVVRIGNKFRHTKEVVQELGIFEDVVII
jgi:hypothetical protein